MTSQINTSNIDANFPVQGQDNPSQGFRDNFSHIKINFDTAAEEITTLQDIVLGATGTIIVSATSTFLLSTATQTTLGGVKIGTGINITADGTISATTATPYTLVTATNTRLGGIKIGGGLNITADGTVYASTSSFTLTPATTTSLGGVKIGSGISLSPDGTISVSTSSGGGSGGGGAGTYVLTTATADVLGGVKIGAGIGITTDGVISVTTAAFALLPATQFILGGVKTGNQTVTGIAVDGTGTISLVAAGQSNIGGIKIGAGLIGTNGDGTVSVATATTFSVGGVRIGTGVAIDGNGTISIDTANIPITATATNVVLGGVKIGTGISAAQDGTISLSTATAISLGAVKIGNGISVSGDGTISVLTGGSSSFNQNLNTTDSPTFAGLTLNGVGGRLYGDFTSTPEAARLMFQTTVANGLTRVYAIPKGTSREAGFGAINNPNPANAAYLATYINSSEARIESRSIGGGTDLPLSFVMRYGSTAMRINADTSINMYNITDSTSKTTGALTVAGGVGVSGNVYATYFVGDGSQLSNVAAGIPASQGRLGPVKIGAGVNVDINGVISVTTGAFALQTATNAVLGGVKIGTGINVTSDGTISTNITTASTTITGVVKIGTGIGIAADGTISVTTASFALQTATNVILGGIKVGAGVNISSSGTISITAENLSGTTLSNSITNLGPLKSLVINGPLTIGPTYEQYIGIGAQAGGTQIFNCSSSSVFVVSSATGFAANFTNVSTDSNRATGVAVIINQGVAAQIPSPVAINGINQTVKWSGGIQPNGNAGKIDVVNYTFISQAGTGTQAFTVLANLSSFG
jgi:hypothetical protein